MFNVGLRNVETQEEPDANPHLECCLGADWQMLFSAARPIISGGFK
jgi:hypothetical protein